MTLWYDVVTLMIIFAGMLAGFSMGMVRQLFNVGGLYFGLVFAAYFHPVVSRFATRLLGESDTLSRDAGLFFAVFVAIWLAINLAVYYSFRQPPRFLPASLDRLVGMLLGGVSGILAAIIVSLLLIYGTSVSWPQNNQVRLFVYEGVTGSLLQPVLTSLIPTVVGALEPLLPRGLPAFFSTVR